MQNVIELPIGNGEQDGMVEQLPASAALQNVIELALDKEQDGIDEQWQLVSRSTSQSSLTGTSPLRCRMIWVKVRMLRIGYMRVWIKDSAFPSSESQVVFILDDPRNFTNDDV